MQIRAFRETDTEAVIRLWRDCALVVPQNDPHQDIRRKLRVQPELFLVGLEEDRVVASAMAGYEGHRGWLNYVAVDPELRKRGLGRAIVAEAERRLAALGCPKINLQVRRSNIAVMEFYRRVGYVEDDVTSMGKRLVREPRNNELGQPVGEAVGSVAARLPPRAAMTGRYCVVAPLDPAAHAEDLWDAFAEDTDHSGWTYLYAGPFPTKEAFRAWLQTDYVGDDPLIHAILDGSGRAVGLAGYLRIQPAVGVIEVGHLHYAPLLQRTAAATEAMYLMMRRAFDELGYRRYEWKCDSLNAASRAAALRLGFTYEGVFRQATVYKGRNRDTAWYSVLDTEWPALSRAFVAWLDPGNFDGQGRQRSSLTALRETTAGR